MKDKEMTKSEHLAAIKKSILEAAAINITFKYSHTVYPDALDPYYEEGMSEEDVITAFAKDANLESEAIS